MNKWIEEKKIEFDDALFGREWDKIQAIYIELEERGFGDEVVHFSNRMLRDEVLEYKKWDKRVNGSTEVQTDDNSDLVANENLNEKGN